IELFQCPSSNVEKAVANAQGVDGRVPCTYLACSSGTLRLESGPPPWAGDKDRNISDGIFYSNSETRQAEIKDGTSTTILIGEALFDFYLNGPDEVGDPEIVDHWYIGSDYLGPESFDLSSDVSEAIGSTAAPLNATNDPDSHINEKELCFSSLHPGGAQVVFADGHAKFYAETIDPVVWSALGTRNGGEVRTQD
ncbi:MAG: DUF1559 domain-containing protein, partial [Planctomycetota bacterium]